MSGSQTITRPVIMELLPITYISADGTSVLGNKDLVDSENTNVDFKYELFPTSKEMVTVGLFGKKLKNPIERIFIAGAGGSGQITTFKNSKEATLFGTEIEFLLQLSRISQSLSNFSFGLNTTIMTTEVSVDYGDTSLENTPKRDLQGASNWIVNSDIKYDFQFNEIMKNTISLVYGVYGDRIFAVGGSEVDHIYEKSFHKLDFVWSSKLSEKLDVKLSVDNLLNPTYKLELGKNSPIEFLEKSYVMESFKRGTGISLNLSYTF